MPSSAASKVIPCIHQAALDPRQWQAVADALADAADGVFIHLMFFDTANPGAEVMIISRYDPAMIATFNEYYGSINPWQAGLIRFPSMTAVTTEQMLPQGDISAGVGMILQQYPSRILVMGGHIRMRDQDRLERSWQNVANELGPTLRHAVEVNRVLAGLRLENGLLAQGLSPKGASAFVLSDDLRVLFASYTAGCQLGA